MQQHLVIAIDGPAGAGKSTVAKQLATRFHVHVLDTGALFRAFALCVLRKGIDPLDAPAVEQALKDARLDIETTAQGQRTLLNGEDVSALIRTPEVSAGASALGANPYVRGVLTQQVRQIAQTRSLVVDGRDVGTAMLPNAKVKFFLTASAEERARRRMLEQQAAGQQQRFEAVLQEIEQRDAFDMQREIAPLCQAEDAHVVDSTGLTIADVVSQMARIVEASL